MIKFLKQLISDEKGQALPIVLSLLTLGGLVIAPTLDRAATSLNSGRNIEDYVKGIYAADAGVENTLWRLQNGLSPLTQLSESIDGMEVTIQTIDKGVYTLYLGGLVQTGQHSDYLNVDGDIAWDADAGAYKYTITVTWQPGSGVTVIHLEGIGARIPAGYSYQAGSAAGFPGNLSLAEPDVILDEAGAQMLDWECGSPYPSVSESNPVKTQTFHITGAGSLEGDYTWVVANRTDIGAVGEITGNLNMITATATSPETAGVTARTAADVVVDGSTVYVVSWQVSK